MILNTVSRLALVLSGSLFILLAGCQKEIPVVAVTLNESSLNLSEGKTANLVATVLPENATNAMVKWNSSDPGTASVDNGLVTAVKAGNATITATTVDGGKKDECYVTVTAVSIAVTGVTLDQTSVKLFVGTSVKLTPTVKPDDATDKSVVWNSSDANIASVDENGNVDAKASGTATITVATMDGDKMATCDIIVSRPGINIPDANFKSYLLNPANGINVDNDTVITPEEAAAVKSLSVGGLNIASLEGLEYFTSLIDLSCSKNAITELDLSKNVALWWLQCSYNKLTSIDLSNNSKLYYLDVNDNQIQTLDLKSNPALSHISCNRNLLSSLDVTRCPVLKYLYCTDNKLESLDISGNPSLQQLWCCNNRLTTLNASTMVHSSDLVLVCGNQHDADGNQISINLLLDSAMKEYWDGTKGNPNNVNIVVTYLGISSEGGVTIPDAKFKAFLLDTANHINTNRDSTLTAEELAKVTYLSVERLGISSLDGIQYFTSLQNLYCFGNKITNLDLSHNSALAVLNCSDNGMESLNVSGCGYLTDIDCSGNHLTSLDVSGSPALTSLTCDDNRLNSIDIGHNPALRKFNCYDNDLNALNTSGHPVMSFLDCHGNKITALDISSNKALSYLNCYDNQIPSLNAAAMSDPSHFILFCGSQKDASGNNVKLSLTLDESQRSQWSYLATNWLMYNDNVSATFTSSQTQAIDIPDPVFKAYLLDPSHGINVDMDSVITVSEAAKATSVDVRFKGIESLEGIQYFVSIISLYCNGNKLKSLDVSKCVNLKTLACNNNQLSILNVGANPLLDDLTCNNNRLSSLDASTMSDPSYFTLYCGRQTDSNGSSVGLKLTLSKSQEERWSVVGTYSENANVTVTYK